jgi:hypothetical protein
MATLHTPNRSYPYPDGAERVMDGDNAIGALAQALDADVARLWAPPGIVLSGAAFTQTASTQNIPCGAIVEGNSALYDGANKCVLVPAAYGGLYLVTFWGSVGGLTPGGHLVAMISCGPSAGGKNYFAQEEIWTAAALGPTSTFAISATIMVPGGYAILPTAGCAVNNWGTWIVSRFSAVRLGSGWGMSARDRIADELGPDAKPARRRRS